MTNGKKEWVVWAVTERTVQGEQKSFWTKIGRAFENRDNSINLRIDCVPLSGQLQLREPEQEGDQRAARREDRRDDRTGRR